MRLRPVTLLALAAAATVRAHIVPVPPSTCAFDPLVVEMPSTGLVATGAPAGPADTFHILYDPQASMAQFNLTDVPPRTVTAVGVTGTLALSTIFGADLRNDGNLQATPSFTFTTPGGSATAPIPLTTGLVVAGDTVLEGAPIGPDGRFTLTGSLDPSPLAPPLSGGPLVVRLSGQAVPRPDTDQFRIATRTTPLSASITTNVLRARLIFAPGTMDVPDFAGRPARVRISSGDTTIATADLASGLGARGKKLFIGRSTDGRAALGVHTLRRSGEVDYLFALKLKKPTLPPAATGTVQVTVTYDVGGLLSRVTLAMRAKRRGTTLRYP